MSQPVDEHALEAVAKQFVIEVLRVTEPLIFEHMTPEMFDTAVDDALSGKEGAKTREESYDTARRIINAFKTGEYTIHD